MYMDFVRAIVKHYRIMVPIDTIADLAGHSSIETTRIYTRKSKEELRNVIDKIIK
ncbi:integrase [Clostridium beijerinckii]|uniref:Integrase n=1 Tax=Clostridium beijerinckii TaxID=1520 RepID=A0AAX0B112_CLOBE|nr:integrase [Clostridium beijerinckii]